MSERRRRSVYEQRWLTKRREPPVRWEKLGELDPTTGRWLAPLRRYRAFDRGPRWFKPFGRRLW